MDVINKLNIFINEKETGTKPMQFFKWWNGFRPGERCDVEFGDGYINIISSSMGNFSGIKKEINLEKKNEIDEFKNLERNVWNFC